MTENRLPFRPLDNGPSTNLAYSLEANHWLRAINSAQASTMSFASSFHFIGTLIGLLICGILIIFSLLIKLFIFIFGKKDSSNRNDNTFDPHKYPHEYQFQEEPDEKYFHSWK